MIQAVPETGKIQLDADPTGQEEAIFTFSNPEEQRAYLENSSFEQDIKERKAFADKAYSITQTWIGFLIVLTFAQFLLKKLGFGLDGKEFIVVFTTTTVSVFGFWVLVGQYLFNSKRPLKSKLKKTLDKGK